MTLVSGRMITSKVTKSTFFGEKNIIPKLCIDFFSKLNFFPDFTSIHNDILVVVSYTNMRIYSLSSVLNSMKVSKRQRRRNFLFNCKNMALNIFPVSNSGGLQGSIRILHLYTFHEKHGIEKKCYHKHNRWFFEKNSLFHKIHISHNLQKYF